MGLDEQLDRYPDDFSGGQQQRIAIARAVVGRARRAARRRTDRLPRYRERRRGHRADRRAARRDTAPRWCLVIARAAFRVVGRSGRLPAETVASWTRRPRSQRRRDDGDYAAAPLRRRLKRTIAPSGTAAGGAIAARLARREVRRRWGRTLLVMILVAVPVFGMTVITTLVRTTKSTAARDFDARVRAGEPRGDRAR